MEYQLVCNFYFMKNHILCLETSSTNCSVSISKNNKIIYTRESDGEGYKHSEFLHSFIEESMVNCKLEYDELMAVSVGIGPGSFTGLRIGLSSAKGICYSKDIPLITVNSLEILAQKYKTINEEILVPMFDARRMEVYFSIFDKNHKQLKSPISRILSEDFFHDFPNKKKVIFGNGAEKCRSIFNSNEFKYIIEISNPSSKEMGEISYVKFLKKDYANLAYCEPLYLKNNYLKN